MSEILPHPLLPAPRGRVLPIHHRDSIATVFHGEPYIRTEETRWMRLEDYAEETSIPIANRIERAVTRLAIGIRNALLLTIIGAVLVCVIATLFMRGCHHG